MNQVTEEKGSGNAADAWTYKEAEQYINEIPRFAGKNTVEDVGRLLALLMQGEQLPPVIHVAGTNGKGSVCTYLSAILKASGRRVGVFTSPHLTDMRERICIDGEMIAGADFTEAFLKVMTVTEIGKKEGLSHPSFFEYLFLMAMSYFREKKPDVIILETGLGGRLDATNCVQKPAVCVITEIGFDHMEYLGNSLSEIAAEKAGIIKDGVPVVFADKKTDVTKVLLSHATAHESPVRMLMQSAASDVTVHDKGIDFSLATGYYNYVGLSLLTPAIYQVENASLAVLAAETLSQSGIRIKEAAIRDGLKAAVWPGRMEEVMPLIWLDGAHNEDGMEAFLTSVGEMPCEGKRLLLFGVVTDKRYDRMIHQIVSAGLFEEVFVTALETKRSAAQNQLKKLWEQYEIPCSFHRDAAEAFRAVCHRKEQDDMVFVAGSLYLIGQIEALVRRTTDD